MTGFGVSRYASILWLGFMAAMPAEAQKASPITPQSLIESTTDPIARECLERIAPSLVQSEGQFTTELRKTYIDWCWSSILRALMLKQQTVSDATIADIQQDSTLKDAICGSVYPPDPSILQNYDLLQTQLGKKFTTKYRNLAIGIAVARRVKGVETDPGANIGRENQVPIWAYSPLQRPASEADRQFVVLISKFIRSRSCSAQDVFNNPDLRKQLRLYLTESKVEARYINEVDRTTGFGERLKNAMIVLNQRPASRTQKPNCVDWLKHLIATYESNPISTPSEGMHWPLFSLEQTPWPLLMPLSHPVPLDEAKYLWDSFQGLHGQDRYHTYGPYRDDLTAMPDMLAPSKWFWNAVPDQIIHGGQCMPISLATLDLYSSLGKPATDAAQPGHANLISYLNDGGTWKADIEQDFAGGARVTYSQWYFDDQPRSELHFRDLFGWPGAEYHLGLAVAMNLGVSSYVDTRIASRIFDLLPKEARKKMGHKLLTSALQANPFNPEVWYRMGAETSDSVESLALAKTVKAHDPNHLIDALPSKSSANFLKTGRAAPAVKDMDDYWSVLLENLSRLTLLARGAPKDETAMHDTYTFLTTVPGLDASELAGYTKRFVGVKTVEAAAQDAQVDLKLAESGDAFGCLRMGQRYLDGDGVPHDERKAREYLIRAARQGEISAAYGLENLSIPMSSDGVAVSASSTYSPTQDVHHLINGAGMTGGVHDNNGPAATMWQTVDNPPSTVPVPGLPASPAWVRFNFPQPRTFDAVEIWNHNQANLTDRGFRKFQIYGTLDGKHWSPLTHNAELPRASGGPFEPAYTVQTTSSGRLLKSVIITAAATGGNYGSADFGLSAVRFVTRPVAAALPAYQIQVHASSQYSDSQTANHLIDGAGMTGEFHDNHNGAGTMWQTLENPISTAPAPLLYKSPAWVRFNFSVPRYFESIKIWNHNQAGLTNRGFRKMRIYGTSDGVEWFVLTTTDDVQLPMATGASLSAGTTFFNVSPERPIRSVVIIADPQDGNYGSNCFGLSAVRFIMPSSVPSTESADKQPVR